MNSNTYSIQIVDDSGNQIGELMTATPNEIIKLINKGFIVIDKMTGSRLTEQMMTSVVGVSDGLINMD